MRLLVVDDEPAVRRILERLLRHLGYDVVLAADADSAYALLGEGGIGAVILDLRMPQLPGPELYIAIARRWPELRRRVVLMSGELHPARDRWPDDLRACPLLAKPFTLDVLRRVLDDVLAEERREPRRSNGC
jgi:DNA-binding NtrC family response regulator